MLERLGAEYLLVRTPEQVAQVDAMILPGGESTTMLKFLQEEGLEAPLRALAGARRRVFCHLCRCDSAGARSARSGAGVTGPRRRRGHAQRLWAAARERSSQCAVEIEAATAGDGIHPRAHIGRDWRERRGACHRPRPAGAGPARKIADRHLSPGAYRRHHHARVFPEAGRRACFERRPFRSCPIENGTLGLSLRFEWDNFGLVFVEPAFRRACVGS